MSNTATVTVTQTSDYTVTDGMVVQGTHPQGAKTSNPRYRINGEWVYGNGRKTGEPDLFYAQGIADRHFTRVL